jgi:hypothetical protein
MSLQLAVKICRPGVDRRSSENVTEPEEVIEVPKDEDDFIDRVIE